MLVRQNLLVFLSTFIVTLAGGIYAEVLVPPEGELLEIVASATPEGWELYDEVLQFSPDDLYQHINGRAELFLSYNVVSLTCATFDESGSRSTSIDLSVYDMGSALNAFGIFSVERSLGEQPIPLGREAYRSGASHYVWKGQYYVRAIASCSEEMTREAAWRIVRKLTDQLKDTGEEIWGANLFPSKALVSDSLKYFLVDALGLDFMRNTFTALYRMDGIEIPGFISRRESREGALSAFRQYSSFGERYGRGVQRTIENDSEFLVCEMKEGYDVVATKGIYLIGVTAVPDRALALEAAIELHSHCCSNP